jgi:hypothetical protein
VEKGVKKMKADLKDKIQKYKKLAVAVIRKQTITPFCILCDREDDIICKALWVDDEKKTLTLYWLCRDCVKEFRELPESQRISIIQKVIEIKITTLSALSHHKMSDLKKRGVKIEF